MDIFLLSFIQLDEESSVSLYQQLYDAIRQGVLNGDLKAGARLPSHRDMADLLTVSRNTVVNALDQLVAEGYLVTRPRAGTYVTDKLPETFGKVVHADLPDEASPEGERRRSERSYNATDIPEYRPADHVPFRVGSPDLDEFPWERWSQLVSQRLRYQPLPQFAYTRRCAGWEGLRTQITDYLAVARAVQCEPEQVIITTGAQQAIYLAGCALLDPGDRVLVEDPGYLGARRALCVAEAKLVPVTVDEQGIRIDSASGEARVVFTTPSRQAALGHTLSLARRCELVEWAQRVDGWIIEDDYDSEFRYDSRPIASLHSLDPYQRVIYIGTFSKVMFPSLRLGYVVVPPDLVDTFVNLRGIMDSYTPTPSQYALAEFMQDGDYTRHIRRMRQLYKHRRDVMVNALCEHMGEDIQLGPTDAGMNVTLHLPPNVSDTQLAATLHEAGINAEPLSVQYLDKSEVSQGLVLGYTGFTGERLTDAVRHMADIMRPVIRG
jgi:GntR family transcriptional regulator/MocR family aminotransferase